MKKTEQLDHLIVEHAFQSETNFKMAVQVGLAFPDLQTRIIGEFAAALRANLKKRLGPQWQVSDDLSNALSRPGFITSVRKKEWLGADCIGLAWQKGGPSILNWYIYVEPKVTPVQHSEIKAILDSKYAVGRKYGSSNPWWLPLDHKIYQAWNTEKALVELWKKDDAVEYYASQLARIAKIASPIINQIRKQ